MNRKGDNIDHMTKTQALAHFNNNVSALTRALGLKQNALYSWEGDSMPPIQQIRLEAITNGVLRADNEAWSPADPRYSQDRLKNGRHALAPIRAKERLE